MKKSIILVSLLLCLPAFSQSPARRYQLDSTVTVSSDGSRLVEYRMPAYDFGPVVRRAASKASAASLAEKDRQTDIESLRNEHEQSLARRMRIPERIATMNLSDYAVGEIPIREGISPTGARTYQIPIAAASGFRLTPSIAIGYNSQASEGWAGYGWDIQGVSAISLISKNKYYHETAKGANANSTDAVFALDGIPLVTNTQTATRSAFPLITATGNIIASATRNSQGFTTSFTVKYPNGVTASFGTGNNTSCNLPSYPITEMTDLDGNRITFHYSSDPVNGNDRLTAIRYGYVSSSQFKGEMTFAYAANSVYPTRYYAGKSVYRDYRLTGITSKDNGTTICQYAFSYIQQDNVQLLTQVDCSSEGESLCPLVFEYGEADGPSSTNYLYYENDFCLTSYFSQEEVGLYYKRGKFVQGSYNDGLLIYPHFDEYGVIASYKPAFSARQFLFGSLYPDNQVILFAPSLTYFSHVDNSITTGSGFQTIEAVDADGDGLDELVKVNFNGTSGSNSRLLITIYDCSSSGVPVQSSQFEILLQGVITRGDYISPYRRTYHWGDFLGNGKAQLLAVAFDTNSNQTATSPQNSYASLIDLSTHTKLCDAELFDFPVTNRGSLLTCDLDNDGQTELCYATASGFDVYRFGSAFTLERTLTTPTSSVLSDTTRTCHITDLNGDGYIDIMQAPSTGDGTSWTRYAFNGDSFISSSVSLTSRAEGDEFSFADINQDGLSDLVKISGTTLGSYLNLDGSSFGSFSQSPSTITNSKGIVPGNIVDYSGVSNFIKVDSCFVKQYKYSAPSPDWRQLTRSLDSKGRVMYNTYEYLPYSSRYWTDSSLNVSNSSGFAFKTLPIYVLLGENAYLSENYNTKRYKSKYYSYYNGVVHSRGLGFCGFSKIITQDYNGGTTEIVEEIHNPEKRGVVTSVNCRLRSLQNAPFSSAAYTYDDNSTTYGKLNPRLIKSLESNALTGVMTTTSYTYGDYDLPTMMVTGRRIGEGTLQSETHRFEYQNSATSSKYVLGSVTEELVVRNGDGDASEVWMENTVNTYDSNCHPLTSKHYSAQYTPVGGGFIINDFQPGSVITGGGQTNAIRPPIPDRPPLMFLNIPIDPDDPGVTVSLLRTDAVADAALVSETRWTYDSRGNVLSETSAPFNATEFIGDTYTYDNDARFLLTKTDALGRTTSLGGYDKFGNPASVTDYRNRVTSYTYDAFGNLVSTTGPDGSAEQMTAAWGGTGLYTVMVTATGQPETVTHYDALDREVRSGVKRFDGQWQWVDREYDNRGRLYRTSLPYRGSSASYWNVCAYDDYSRPVSVTEASGKTSTWSYSGVSVTTVKDGISSTSTTDAAGNVISVTDAGGTITYTLRDDGQPSSVTAPGNVVTTFTYDSHGRRTSITDPSAGTHTDAYVWNSDASSEVTHTSPYGSVKTYRDKYGRTTLVERTGEFDTAYTYDGNGLLSTEQSTNGTGREYTYDALDRITAVKETVPDGKWLRKAFTYGSGSVVASVQFSTPSGVITTESYSYANGHNTGISLPDGTAVWTLTAENDLGMATSITSGSISREYGFTAFGMPTFRKMNQGSLQNFTYSFEVATGNLLSRSDLNHSQTESFGYDNLSRLTSIGARQVSYAGNGNILSISGVGSMGYGDAQHPYDITTLTPEPGGPVLDRQRSVSYTSFLRPSVLTEGGKSAAFTYNGDGDRVKMTVTDGSSQVLSRYYIGSRYEYDQTSTGSKERLYLGGDAYSAPMAYQRENSGNWTAYNIGRDYLGNITHIATASGTPVAEYSYDPWGRLRNPQSLEIYAAGSEPDLFLGRGFTGHEVLPWFGLVNMNARLYDPLLGRFLSPDPYIQSPDFTQNFNRYSYCLNNPLKYTDESGEWIGVDDLIAGLIGGVINWATNGFKFTWEGLSYFGIGAAGGVASLYVSPIISAGAVAGANNIISQGFSGGNWNGSNINWSQVGFSAIMGGVTSYFSGALSSSLSNSLGKLTSKIPGKAWAGMINRGITGGVTGFSIGAIQTAITSYKETGHISWDDVWTNAGFSALTGLTAGAISGMAEGIREAKADYKNPWTGKDRYPNNFGFEGLPEMDVLQPGIYDRYGSIDGSFLAPEGTPFEQRSLPAYKNDASLYSKYKVIKPIPGVKIGKAAPWFGYSGGGTQYYLPMTIRYYIDKGYIIKL